MYNIVAASLHLFCYLSTEVCLHLVFGEYQMIRGAEITKLGVAALIIYDNECGKELIKKSFGLKFTCNVVSQILSKFVRC